VQLLRAAVLVRGGSVGEALPVLTDLAARHPDEPDTLLVLGNAQDILERPEAEATLRRFLELAPDAPAAAVVRERLAQR
jgi:predicted Zn-dependent protease